jgi:hypothetical protein
MDDRRAVAAPASPAAIHLTSSRLDEAGGGSGSAAGGDPGPARAGTPSGFLSGQGHGIDGLALDSLFVERRGSWRNAIQTFATGLMNEWRECAADDRSAFEETLVRGARCAKSPSDRAAYEHALVLIATVRE